MLFSPVRPTGWFKICQHPVSWLFQIQTWCDTRRHEQWNKPSCTSQISPDSSKKPHSKSKLDKRTFVNDINNILNLLPIFHNVHLINFWTIDMKPLTSTMLIKWSVGRQISTCFSCFLLAIGISWKKIVFIKTTYTSRYSLVACNSRYA